MPAQPRKKTSPETGDVEVVEESLAADLAAEDTTPEKPAGSPDLIPTGALPRRRRAEFFGPLEGLLDDDGLNLSDLSAVASVKAVADIEDAIRAVIVPVPGAKARAEAWFEQCSDEELMALFAWYMSTMQPGEAQPSQS